MWGTASRARPKAATAESRSPSECLAYEEGEFHGAGVMIPIQRFVDRFLCRRQKYCIGILSYSRQRA
jgi:hypothetical protein